MKTTFTKEDFKLISDGAIYKIANKPITVFGKIICNRKPLAYITKEDGWLMVTSHIDYHQYGEGISCIYFSEDLDTVFVNLIGLFQPVYNIVTKRGYIQDLVKLINKGKLLEIK